MLKRYILSNFEHYGAEKKIECLLYDDGTPFHPACFYLWHLKCIQHAADNTCQSQANQIKSFINFLIRNQKTLKDINSETLQKYLFGYLFKLKKLKSSSVSIHADTIKSFIQFCSSREFIKEPILDFTLPFNETGYAKAAADIATEIKQLYMDPDSLKLLSAYVPGKSPFVKERNKLILYLGYYAGLRTSDVASNPIHTIDYFQRLIPNTRTNMNIDLPRSISFSYRNKKSKKTVTIQIGHELIRKLHDFLYHQAVYPNLTSSNFLISTQNGKPLLDEKIGTRVFMQAVSELIKHRTLTVKETEVWRQRHFHILRKCFATNTVAWCRKHGLPASVIVKEYLGHTDFRTSVKHYILADWLLNKHSDRGFLENLRADETKLGQIYLSRRKLNSFK